MSWYIYFELIFNTFCIIYLPLHLKYSSSATVNNERRADPYPPQLNFLRKELIIYTTGPIP